MSVKAKRIIVRSTAKEIIKSHGLRPSSIVMDHLNAVIYKLLTQACESHLAHERHLKTLSVFWIDYTKIHQK